MTIKELITELQQFQDNAEVFIGCEIGGYIIRPVVSVYEDNNNSIVISEIM